MDVTTRLGESTVVPAVIALEPLEQVNVHESLDELEVIIIWQVDVAVLRVDLNLPLGIHKVCASKFEVLAKNLEAVHIIRPEYLHVVAIIVLYCLLIISSKLDVRVVALLVVQVEGHGAKLDQTLLLELVHEVGFFVACCVRLDADET